MSAPIIQSQLQVKPARAYLQSLSDNLNARGTAPTLPLLTLPRVSDKMWGLQPKALTCIAARPSQGKTAFTMQACVDIASQGFPTVIVSLEMEVLAILERIFCNLYSVNNEHIQRGLFKQYPNQWRLFCDHINKIPLIITESVGYTFDDIENMLDRMPVKPKVVCIDYIGLVKGESREKKDKIDDYIKSFRSKSIKDDFAAVVCAQINREGSGKEGNSIPGLHHIKDSGGIEEHADKVILLHNPKFYNELSKEEYMVILAKNRNGRTGRIEGVKYIGEFYKFKDGTVPQEEITLEVQQAMEMFNAKEVTEHTKVSNTAAATVW